jgi:FkbM family methyltransferase
MDGITLTREQQAPGYATVGPLKVSYINPDSLQLLFDEIFVADSYWFETDRTAPFIIDCGSNIGMSILYFKFVYPDAEIIAFEPSEDAFARLAENIEINNLSGVQVHQVALAAGEGTAVFYYDPDNLGSLLMSTDPKRMAKARRMVETVRLSTYVTRSVDLLKIDVEGAELQILRELQSSGKLSSISEMVIEYHHHIDSSVDDFSTILRLLEENDFGYQIACDSKHYFRKGHFQDISIRAYRKRPVVV